VIEVPEGAPPALPAGAGDRRARRPKAAFRRKGPPRRRRPSSSAAQAYATMLLKQQSGLQAAFEKPLKALFGRLGKAAAMRRCRCSRPKAEKADELLIAMILDKLGIPYWRARAAAGLRGAISRGRQGGVRRGRARRPWRVAAGPGRAVDRRGRRPARGPGRSAGANRARRCSRRWPKAAPKARARSSSPIASRSTSRAARGPAPRRAPRSSPAPRPNMRRTSRRSSAPRPAASTASWSSTAGSGPAGRTLFCMARNNSIVTADQATAMADTEHPNGTLSFAPYFEE
jgi:hypothetical protein